MLIQNPAQPFGTLIVLYRIIGANMNSTADQPFVKLHSYAAYSIQGIRALNASISMTTAAGGIYTGAAKSGTTLVAASQAYSALTASAKGVALTLVSADAQGRITADPILSLTTGQGSAATADFYILGLGVV